MRGRAGLVAVAVVVAVSAALILLTAPRPLRIAAAAALFLLPGYFATQALFPHGAIQRAQRLLLTLALSFSLAIFAALVLNFTFGLRASSWVGALGVISVASYLLAPRRFRSDELLPRFAFPRVRVRDAALLVLAAALLGAAVAVARTPLRATNVHGYTALWLLPARANSAVHVGLRSGELQTTSYRLVIRAGDRVLYNEAVPAVVPGGQFGKIVALPKRVRTRRTEVEALLYRAQRPRSVYRSVTFRFPRRG
jgi:uncharacterized membrane protein